MNKEQLVIAVAELLLNEWHWLLGIIGGLIMVTVSGTWFIAALFHRREIELLKSQVSFGESKLDQLERIMEQRIKAAEDETLKLQNKLIAAGKIKKEKQDKDEPLYQDPTETNEYAQNEEEYLSMAADEISSENIRNEKMSDLVSGISRVVEQLVKFNALY